MTDDDTKVCSRCGEARPIEQFWRAARKPDGRESVCGVCRSYAKAQRLGRAQTPRKDVTWLKGLLPLLAARLCAQLYGEDAPPLPVAYGDVELISPRSWHQIMSAICQGASPRNALRKAGIRESVFRAFIRYEPRLTVWHKRALSAAKRKHWSSLLDTETILRELIRNPGMSARAACQKHGVLYKGFLARTTTPDFESRYLSVRSVQRDRSFEAMSSELTALGDGVTRAAKRNMAQRVCALESLEPRRGRPRKPLTEIEEARKRVAAARR